MAPPSKPSRLLRLPRSLRVQVSLALLVAAAMCAFVAGYFSGQELASTYRANAEGVLAGATRSFKSHVEPADLDSPSEMRRRLGRIQKLDPNLSAVLVFGDRRPAAAVGSPRISRADDPVTERVRKTGSPALRERRDAGVHHLTRTERIGRGRKPAAALWLSYDLRPADALIASRNQRIFGVLAILLLSFTAFTAWVLTRGIFRPLHLLRMATRRIAEGRLETRLNWDRRDELGVLARDFDQMAAELERGHGRLESLARKDPLTGLANHRQFQEVLHTETSHARTTGAPLALIVLDIDRFKRINDGWGHPIGDDVLAQAGITLPIAMQGAGIAARLGGDEFAMLIPDCEPQRAMAICEAARAAIKANDTSGLGVTCSAGVAMFPEDASSAESLMQVADGALYWAKRAGRDAARRYDPEHVLVVTSEQRAEFADLLDQPDAITPVFQPIVSLPTGEVLAYEALARFESGGRRRPPSWWFAQAHRFGMGPSLEARAVEVALAVPRPPGVSISVNVSHSTLSSPELTEVLPQSLEGVIFEITEQEEIVDPVQLQEVLQPLRERGARVAVDDAGAGYAGLQQIMRIKADFIKLDRALVSGVHLDHAKLALIGSMVDYGNATGAEVCAEGIETLDELRALVALGVCCGQGYVLARPAAPWASVDREAAELCRSLSRETTDRSPRLPPATPPRRRSHTSAIPNAS